jgi:geranylgeranyl pyrophosphate synthase
MARQLRDDALHALEALPDGGGRLRQLADFIVSRRF